MDKIIVLLFLAMLMLPISEGTTIKLTIVGYSEGFNVQVGDSKEYKITNIVQDPKQEPDYMFLENYSLVSFNRTKGLSYRYTVVNVNQSSEILPKQIYVQENVNTYYYVVNINLTTREYVFGSIKSMPLLVTTSTLEYLLPNMPIFPSFKNETMVKIFLKESAYNYKISGDFYILTSQNNIYPYNVPLRISINWKTGWLRYYDTGGYKIEMVNNDFLTLPSNSPVLIGGLGLTSLVLITMTILIIRYKHYLKTLGKVEHKVSFKEYTKKQLHIKKNQSRQNSIHIKSALHKIEEIIDENT